MQGTRLATFYDPGQFSKPSAYIERFEIYRQIQAGTFAAASAAILNRHAAAIRDGFNNVSKSEYQADKKRLLPSAVFSGADRSRNDNQQHTGILSADIDENSPDELRALFAEIQAGKIQFIEAAGRSISGALTGALWANFKIQIPARFAAIPAKVVKLAYLDKTDTWGATLEKIHKAYGAAFAYLLKKERSIKLGSHDYKRGRYLANDPELYVNQGAKEFSLLMLCNALEEIEAGKETNHFERAALDIAETDAFRFAEKFAAKEYSYENRQLYISRLAICLNLLGVSEEQAESYVSEKYPDYDLNRRDGVRYPYRKYRQSFGLWAYKLTKTENNRTIIQGRAGQYCGELLDGVDTRNIRLIAPTGTGKTFWVANLQGCRVLVCPTLALVNNAAGEYGAFKFAGNKNRAMYEGLKTAKFIVTTYASFHKLTAVLVDAGRAKDFRLFIDEAHNLSASAARSFMLKEVNSILEGAKEYAAVTYMTGTEVFTAHPDLKALPVIEIRLPKKPVEAFFIDAADVLKSTATAFKKSIRAGRLPVVLFDNKSEDGRLGTLKMLIGRDDVEFFNSDNKDSATWKALTSTGYLPEDVAGFVTTSVFKEGNNLKNEREYDFLIVGSYGSFEMEQLLNRARKAKDVKVYLIRSVNREKDEKWFNPERYAAALERRAQHAVNELNTPSDCDEIDLLNELTARQSIQTLPVVFKDGKYQIDFSLLDNQVLTAQRIAENRNDELMKVNLAKYGIKVTDCRAETVEQSGAELMAGKIERGKCREKIEQRFAECLNEISCHYSPLDYCEQQLNGERQLSKAEKLAFGWFVKFTEYLVTADEIIELMRAAGPKNAKLSLERKRLTIHALRSSEKYMNENRGFAIVMKAIYNTFKPGDVLNSEEMKEKLLKCLTLDKGFDTWTLEQQRNAKTLNIVRIFFDVTKKQRKIDGVVTSEFKIGNLIFENNIEIKSKIRLPEPDGLILNEQGYPAFWD